MRVKRFDDPKAFYDYAGDFLVAHEAENNLPLGLINGLIISREFAEFPPYLAAVEDDAGKIVLAAVRTPPRNLILSYTETPEAMDTLIADMAALYGTLPAANAMKPLAADFAQRWTQHTGQRGRVNLAMRIYKLTEVISVHGVPGTMRLATPADRTHVEDWSYNFQMDCFGHADRDEAREAANRWLQNKPEMRGLFYWEVDGQPVAMAGYTGPTPNSFRVGAVYTPPDQRRKGYASALVAALSQHILDMGKTMATLFTDLANPTSNHIYQEVGYMPVCDVDEYRFEEITPHLA